MAAIVTWKLAVMVSLLMMLPIGARAVSITFDYRFDTHSFFASPERRGVLEQAGSDLAGLFGDDLEPIIAAGSNTWTARFTNPSSGTAASVANLVVPRDSLVVFVGARDLGSGTLGFASPGTASVTGTREWFDTIQYRGELGAAESPASDFGPWGGFASFHLDTDWYFDILLDDLVPSDVDFYSVAVHELLHVMGFGLSSSWRDQISIGRFTGDNAVGSFGGLIRLSSEHEHWLEGTLGSANGQPQEALMTPLLPTGQRVLLTELDRAGLQDVGWVLVPEPGTFWLLLAPLMGLLLCRRRSVVRGAPTTGGGPRETRSLPEPGPTKGSGSKTHPGANIGTGTRTGGRSLGEMMLADIESGQTQVCCVSPYEFADIMGFPFPDSWRDQFRIPRITAPAHSGLLAPIRE